MTNPSHNASSRPAFRSPASFRFSPLSIALKKSCETASRIQRKIGRAAGGWRDYRDGLLFDVFDHEYQTDGLEFEVPRQHTRLRDRARFRTGTHESHERRLIKLFLPADACLLELGACLGVVSCVANRILIEPARHVAVEPNAELIPVLTRNRDRNASKFHIDQALVSRISDGTFYVSDCPTTSSADKKIGPAVRVPVTTVEQLEARHHVCFDALLMDIQGGEHAFIAENPDLLRRCRCVILEQHPHIIGPAAADAVRAQLRAFGLRLAAASSLVEAWQRPG